MSAKINVCVIIKDHFDTLRDDRDNKLSMLDIFTLFGIPIIIVIAVMMNKYIINKEFVSLVVNFASIVTSLLISVLVLIYDQYSKVDVDSDASENDIKVKKRELLEQLFSNVSFTILMGIITVIFCLILNTFTITASGYYEAITFSVADYPITMSSSLFMPFILFFLLEMIFTLFMGLKRLHILFFIR